MSNPYIKAKNSTHNKRVYSWVCLGNKPPCVVVYPNDKDDSEVTLDLKSLIKALKHNKLV